MTSDDNRYIVEFVTHGRSIKVTACDTKTLHEVSIIGAKGATQQQLAELAIRKLRYVIDKHQSE